MKATGIIKRIDDLGRIVIPKEIRRNFKIREGDPFEFFIDSEDETICLKPYERVSSKILEKALDTITDIEGFDYADEIRKLLKENKYI